MSETVHWRGKIKEIIIPEGYPTWEKQAKYLQEKGFELADLILEDKYFYVSGSDVVYCNNKWYVFIEKTEVDADEDVCEAEKEGDIIRFELRFYNGGTCFDEMLEDAMNKLK